MTHSELRVEFYERTDKLGKKYYLARPDLPVTIDLSQAALFFFAEDPDGPCMSVRFAKPKPTADGEKTPVKKPLEAESTAQDDASAWLEDGTPVR